MSINDKQVWQQYATALTNLLTTGSFDKNSVVSRECHRQ
jgi:hypothetical protein